MKKLIITIALLLPMLVIGQSQTENYVKTTAYQQPVDEGQEDNLDASGKIEAINYVDGLGRPIQSIAVKAGGQGQNIISYVEYDDLGRTPKQYLPFATTGVVTNPLNFVDQEALKLNIENFYNTPKYEDTQYPFSEVVYENSPLNRVLEQAAPGNSWALADSHTIKLEYQHNMVNEVRYFDVDFIGGDTKAPSLTLSGFYTANELYKSVTKDENWTPASGNNHTTEEFTNKSGQVLLKRTYNDNLAHDTYYVYDDFGNLTFVLSPEGSEKIVIGDVLRSTAGDILNDLCYQYTYDYRNRLIQKKIPAKGWEYILYDKLDRPVLTQDARLRENNQWLFTKYDALNRVLYTGIYQATSGDNETMQSTISTQSSFNETRTPDATTIGDANAYYSNGVFPMTGVILHTINYYDTYVDLSGYVLPDAVYGKEITDVTKGLPTVSKVRVLVDTEHWITTLTGYDYKARPIYGASLNTYLDTEDTSESLLDFVGKVLESRTTHQKSGHQEVVTKDYFTYDHQNRLVTHMQQIDNEPVQLIASNSYDELGQLESKRVGGQLFESGYTDITAGRIDISEDGVITKIAGGDSYNAGLATVGKLEGDGGISFTNLVANKRYIIGFNDNNLYTNSVSEIDYAFFFAWNDPGRYRVQIRENGVASYITGYINFSAGDHFAIEREGNILSFIHNGTTVATHTMTQNFPSLVGDMVMADEGTQISNLNLYATTIDKSLQKVDYQYNVRGWLTDINPIDGPERETDLFQFKINYDAPIEGDAGQVGAVPLYNGNISQTTWQTANSNIEKRTYGYAYDALNRIKVAYSRKGNTLNDYDHYNVSGIDYDKNGNIESLTRQGDYNGNALSMDDLTYTYNGNQLLNVSDNGHVNLKNQGFYDGNTSVTLDDYQYDINGNMVIDRNKGITDITYNHLNLPTSVKISTTDAQGDIQDGTITYIYDAIGIKLAKVLQDDIQQATISTFYAGGYIYENNNGYEDLKMFPHPEGYVEPVYGTSKSIGKFSTETQISSFSNYQYVFNYTDHLGNVRLTYSDSDGDGAIKPAAEIISEKHYYPFGLQQKGYNDVVTSNKNDVAEQFNYQGQEQTTDLGLNIHEWKYRISDPAIGRFWQIDPLAEDYVYNGTYNFAENRVIDGFELEGLEWVDVDDNVVYTNEGGYTEHATDEHRRFGNAVRRTPQGRDKLRDLANRDHPVTTRIDPGSGPSTGSRFTLGATIKDVSQDGIINSSEIVIYEGRISDFISILERFFELGREDRLDEQSRLFIENVNSIDEAIGAVITHEITHTEQENQNTRNVGGDSEEIPEQNETIFLRQLPTVRTVPLLQSEPAVILEN